MNTLSSDLKILKFYHNKKIDYNCIRVKNQFIPNKLGCRRIYRAGVCAIV
jgi:hypothetical protein